MAAVIICSDFGAQEKQICHCFHCFPFYLPWNEGTGCHDLSFWMLSFKPAFSVFSFTFIKRLFSSSLFASRVVSSAYLRLLIFLPEILTPACDSSSLTFHMMYSAYTLNKQDDKTQFCRTSFPNLNQWVSMTGSNCCFLTYIQVSQEIRWSGVAVSLRIFHRLLWSTQSKASA